MVHWTCRSVDVDQLEKCDKSAQEARELGLGRIRKSFFRTKVLYEYLYPPERRGETVYVDVMWWDFSPDFIANKVFALSQIYKGPRVGHDKKDPNRAFLASNPHNTYFHDHPDVLFFIARRFDNDRTSYRGNGVAGEYRDCIFMGWANGFHTLFWNGIRFWSDVIYSFHTAEILTWDRNLDWKEYPDFTRSSNNTRIYRITKSVLGAELDLCEYMLTYHVMSLAAIKRSMSLSMWSDLPFIEAQRDVIEAINKGAQEVISLRRHYTCQPLVCELQAERTEDQPI